MRMCLLMNYPKAIPILDKTAVTVVKTYLQHIYAISSVSVTLITGNGQESKHELSKTFAFTLGIKSYFEPTQSTIHLHLEKFHSFPKASVRKCIHRK